MNTLSPLSLILLIALLTHNAVSLQCYVGNTTEYNNWPGSLVLTECPDTDNSCVKLYSAGSLFDGVVGSCGESSLEWRADTCVDNSDGDFVHVTCFCSLDGCNDAFSYAVSVFGLFLVGFMM
eukprot:TRINITY_DN11043_c0_g1_i1.p1 TRINITY_DN11043_c0_g1~~TRINITY_DN11043_c0_g1_i1.p1  ORF type:complete len:122 (-),score=28.26 TRINITY_DN11043_c0_g1_i1:60-425(-)